MMPYNPSYRRMLIRYTDIKAKKLNEIEELIAKRYQLLEKKQILEERRIKDDSKLDSENNVTGKALDDKIKTFKTEFEQALKGLDLLIKKEIERAEIEELIAERYQLLQIIQILEERRIKGESKLDSENNVTGKALDDKIKTFKTEFEQALKGLDLLIKKEIERAEIEELIAERYQLLQIIQILEERRIKGDSKLDSENNVTVKALDDKIKTFKTEFGGVKRSLDDKIKTFNTEFEEVNGLDLLIKKEIEIAEEEKS